jgi:alkanesulfonate monooxygenase SsuD/methylene tetrahydromethanopterin reductase-like flavin-dependent oxidoreductase (luciferase family)
VIDILRLAWMSESFEYSGEYYSYDPIGINPSPVQGGDVPIWIGTGGSGPKTLDLIASKCTGATIWLSSPDDVADVRRRLDELNRETRIAVGMSSGGDMKPAEVEARAHALAEAGADYLVLAYWGDIDSSVTALRWFASTVRPGL